MTKQKIIALGVASVLFLHGCSKVLEPVSLFVNTEGVSRESVQENFNINIKNLTFKTAKDANNAPYPRILMQNGIGSSANVLDEADFLISNFPPPSENTEYLLGIGDILRFNQLHKFETPTIQFPTEEINSDYLLGIGDELTLIQLNESVNNILSNNKPNINNIISSKLNGNILKTSGFVGTDGNILLLGLGNIKAKNRSLTEIRTEVRNILIRNGLAPSFQLEIAGFNSKKAFVTLSRLAEEIGGETIPITNLPITLEELAIVFGVKPSSKDGTIISLKRNGQNYRMTAGQLFNKSSRQIVIKDRDQIEIDEKIERSSSYEVTVGSRGNILIPEIGSFKAKNRSLTELQADISRTMLEKSLVPSFQLEITDFKSKSFFLITKKLGGTRIPLTDDKLSLKTATLGNGGTETLGNYLTTVELSRNGTTYQMTLQDIMGGSASEIFIEDGDIIELKDFNYKLGQVFAFSGAGNAQMVSINPSNRETLADILFKNNGPLNNLLAKRSEVYLLRGQNPSIAYHLDAQNVSRILVAAKTELRPNDIVYVAERPIISFSRTLSEILPLRILLRDIQNNNLP
jgi:protein involved in polysaccharide export with SLBB domain